MSMVVRTWKCSDEADWRALYGAVLDGVQLPGSFYPAATYNAAASDDEVLADCPHLFDGALLLAEDVIDTLMPMLAGAGYFVDVDLETPRRYHLFICNRVIEAFDLQRSEFDRFPSSGNVWNVYRHEFHADVLNGIDVFKCDQLRGKLLVTDRFVDAVGRHGLIGFEFDHLWNRESGGIWRDPRKIPLDTFPGESDLRVGAKPRAARAALAAREAAGAERS